MNLIICEKQSVGVSIASALGATVKRGAYYEGGGNIVSWCAGHLLELAPPEAYGENLKKWSYADLPIIPEKWKHNPITGKSKQLDILCSLMNRPDVDIIINAADAGREGQLIFQLVYEYANCKKPVKRLWITSTEETAIKAGFANLKDGAVYDGLYAAASCRERADWLVGISATRLFSVLYGGDTLNVGRVQSPTLAMLVNREAEIENFASTPFYTVELDCNGFTASSERFSDKAAAEGVMAGCSTAAVSDVTHTEKSVAPPKLYDLTALQREANRVHGFTAQQTLDYAQSLYEKKHATYPRTDSRFLTEDMAAGASEFVERFAPGSPCDVSQVINPKKVSDHHAIIPTAESVNADLSALPSGERAVLDMLTNRLVCAVGEKHRYLETIITLDAGGREFKSKGKTVIHNGWKGAAKDIPADDEEDAPALPEIPNGITFPVTAALKEGKTSPPKPFTDGTLLAAMENAGSADEAERRGIGTPATRAATLEKLIKTGFAERSKKALLPTRKGKNLIAALPEALKSPALTAEWEHRLQQVERKELDGDAFMSEIAAFMRNIVSENSAPKPEFISLFAGKTKPVTEQLGKCPRCGNGVREGAKGFFCDKRDCGFKLWKGSKFWTAKKKPLTAKIVAALLKDGRVALKKLYSEKSGKNYDATVILDDTGDGYVNYKLSFD